MKFQYENSLKLSVPFNFYTPWNVYHNLYLIKPQQLNIPPNLNMELSVAMRLSRSTQK